MKNFKILFALLTFGMLFSSFTKDSNSSLALVNTLQATTVSIAGHTTKQAAVTVPQKAYTVADYVAKNGKAPQGYVGGTVFQNREGLLPQGVAYKEYDVNPKVNGQNRGTERIILGNDGSRYYTNDHYASFTSF
ncbi:ribonuclease T1 [Pedobacter cryoconitis]|uniref:Ribonuclease n=1 Tax=Pedobacter cryoconitis TaxID=188932 RepID=A0A7W9DN18_9SPHI|nr:ribonuclease domain-containing protein [Pedobacter cryoconitis]MBB5623785.1 ribonuclease T1 [Pedobacter cryoconitis]MBB5645195.1 ribonuclease T1 [Pedobacter cryoconitis]